MRRSLPASLDGVRGLRAARWFRESTIGQWDNFGPEAQREQQDQAIERYGLTDSRLEWSVAASGWKAAWQTEAWGHMLRAAEAGAFDVLVVGYVSRFLRNLKQTLIAIEDHLQPAGVAVLFADEQILSCDPNHWDQFVREAHEAEASSRKLSKRVGEGYRTKRRRLGVPGGNRAPFGIIREGHPSVLRIDEAKAATVRRTYELAAGGCTDWEVAIQVGLAKTHVSEVLTNPIYMGRLRTGEPAGIAPIVDPGLWSAVQTARQRRRTRTPGRIVKRNYALRLRCLGCGRFLYGDIGRYRHPPPTCEDFLAARPLVPRRRRRGPDTRIKGNSYHQDWYEDAVGTLLAEIGGLDDRTITEVVRLHALYQPRADELALARIERALDDAARLLSKNRDVTAWQAPDLTVTAHPYRRPPFLVRHIVNPLRAWLGRRALLGGRPTLTVRGRGSGRPISTPIRVLQFEGARYLVAIGGETHWVRNLRAAGQGELWRGRTHEPFRAVEVDADQRDRVVAAYRALGWGARMAFRAVPDPADHPVFRIEPTASQG